MPVSRDFLDFVLEQLETVGELRPQRLFGGIGLYSRELFFGLLHDDVLFLKVDETTRPAYLAAGMGPFRPIAEQPDYAMHGYYEVPADVLEDREQLAAWARLSLGIAATAPQAKPRAAQPRKKAAGKPRPAPRSAKPRSRRAAGARRRPRGGGSKPPRGR